MDTPVAVWKFSQLHGIIADRRQTVAAGLPGQQHSAGLHLLLGDGWAGGGLRAGWVHWREVKELGVTMKQKMQQSLEGEIIFLASGFQLAKQQTN